MKKKIKIILGYLLIFIFKILNKIFNFKFFHLYTQRIGHLTTDLDSATFNIPKNTILLIGHGNFIANKFIYKFLKNQKKIFMSNFFLKIINCIIVANPNSSLILKHHEATRNFSFHLKFKSKIRFPVYSNEKKKSILSKYNIKKNFVGLFFRNNLYFEKHKIWDPNFHDFRNFNFRDYDLVIEYLTNKNNSIIKLGETFENENLGKFKENIITSLDYSSNDEIDYFLHAHSRYNVFSQSGASGISEILRKKTVYINLIPFSWWKLSNLAPGSIIMPKKIFDLRKKRFLTFKEVLFYEGEGISSIHTKVDPYIKNHLKYIDNSPEEILDAVIQMEEKIEGKNQEQRKKLNDIFWKSVATNNNFNRINYLKNNLKLIISTNFLKNNLNLI